MNAKGAGELKLKAVKPCAAADYYRVAPGKELELDLRSSANKLKEAGYELGIVTRALITFRKGGKEFSMFPSGRMIVRGVASEEEAVEVALEILHLILGS